MLTVPNVIRFQILDKLYQEFRKRSIPVNIMIDAEDPAFIIHFDAGRADVKIKDHRLVLDEVTGKHKRETIQIIADNTLLYDNLFDKHIRALLPIDENICPWRSVIERKYLSLRTRVFKNSDVAYTQAVDMQFRIVMFPYEHIRDVIVNKISLNELLPDDPIFGKSRIEYYKDSIINYETVEKLRRDLQLIMSRHDYVKQQRRDKSLVLPSKELL